MKNLLFLISLALTLSSCDDLTGEHTITVAHLEGQLREIQEFVKKGNCSGAAACSYLPIGSKACGGPAGYIVFSKTIDVQTLKNMIAKYTADQKAYNRENNVISDCSIPSPPEKLDCIDGSCVEIR